MNYFDVYILYSLWVGPHLSSHSYPGQPLGSTASKLGGPFPLEPCSISVRGCSRVLGKELVRCRCELYMSAEVVARLRRDGPWSVGSMIPSPRIGNRVSRRPWSSLVHSNRK